MSLTTWSNNSSKCTHSHYYRLTIKNVFVHSSIHCGRLTPSVKEVVWGEGVTGIYRPRIVLEHQDN